MAIEWTPALRAELSPREPSTKAIDAEKTWTQVRTAFSSSKGSFKKGLLKSDVALEAMNEALAIYESKTLTTDASASALGAMIAVSASTATAREATALVAQMRGARVLAEALVVAHALQWTHRYPEMWLVKQANAMPMGWRALRDAALREGESEVLAIARRVWNGAPLSLKITFAHALSSSSDLAADAAREIAALPAATKIATAPLLATLVDATHLDAVLAHRSGSYPLVDALENFGDAALDAFVLAWSRPIPDRLHLARATSAFVDERAAAVLAKEIDKVTTGEIAREYFIRHPELAERALTTKAKGKFGALAADVLASARRTRDTYDEIPLEDLPMVLARPPWKSNERRRKLIVCEVEVEPRAETIAVSPKRRASLLKQIEFGQFPDMTSEALASFVAKVKSAEISLGWWYDRARVPKDTLRELITSAGFHARTSTYFPFAAASYFGDVVVPAAMDWVVANPHVVLRSVDSYAIRDALLEIDSHRMASALVALIEEGESPASAWRYFRAHVDATIAGVLPIAVSRASNRRRAAEGILRELAIDHGDSIRAAAKARGDRVADAVEEILSFDGRFDCPSKPPKLPAEWRAQTFTRPKVKDGRALPLEALEHIGHMLAFSDPDAPYAGLADVRAACDPRSLGELAWDVGRAWERAGARTQSKWMLEAIALLGDDEVMRRTTPAIKRPEIVAVLGRAATDAAATELCTIAWRLKHMKGRAWRSPWGVRANVMNAFAEIARRRNTTIDHVEDSLAPTIALSEPRMKLDYGSRTIDVGFDERLDPFIESARGKLRKLPKAGKKDDPAKVARAEQIWEELLEDVTAIADLRLDSLERAMISARTWTPDAFRKAWTDHPLMRHLARGVVWRAGTKTFRIAEDGTFADEHDAAFALESEPITVAHPAEMQNEERDAWRRVFFDYRITQPLEQLDRKLLAHASGLVLELTPEARLIVSDALSKLRDLGFETTWRAREQVATRQATRTSHRLRLALVSETRNVIGYKLAAEDESGDVPLDAIHTVDLSEIVHTVSLHPT